ncbi:hypothetical protein [Sutcliffiella rhizosphaerae]|uniref:DUF3828 domain-containing protein n=1 Tax=Sutcliffiella rhizosphaerae TaxID=2880967 RepID=A0ABN8A8K2_9BACI|nr:hypothetical protein [Sutcliffiella rhizosphaerae]CAG9621419.1 hypothetical protein BACCIP111883_02192 [Sutcliffiella rhizosphaerae]
MKRWKTILIIAFGVLFVSGFFFLDSEEALYNREVEPEMEISVGQKRNIMSYIEIAKFKFHNLTMEEHEPNPENMTRDELIDYLSNYFADPILTDLVDYWSWKNPELGSFVEQFTTLDSDIESEPVYILMGEKEVLVRWIDKHYDMEISVVVERNGNGWIIKDMQFI